MLVQEYILKYTGIKVYIYSGTYRYKQTLISLSQISTINLQKYNSKRKRKSLIHFDENE